MLLVIPTLDPRTTLEVLFLRDSIAIFVCRDGEMVYAREVPYRRTRLRGDLTEATAKGPTSGKRHVPACL